MRTSFFARSSFDKVEERFSRVGHIIHATIDRKVDMLLHVRPFTLAHRHSHTAKTAICRSSRTILALHSMKPLATAAEIERVRKTFSKRVVRISRWTQPIRCPYHQAVIGAGSAGLVCAKECRREGHRVVVFEKGNRIGGTWVVDRAPDDLSELSSMRPYLRFPLRQCHMRQSWARKESSAQQKCIAVCMII